MPTRKELEILIKQMKSGVGVKNAPIVSAGTTEKFNSRLGAPLRQADQSSMDVPEITQPSLMERMGVQVEHDPEHIKSIRRTSDSAVQNWIDTIAGVQSGMLGAGQDIAREFATFPPYAAAALGATTIGLMQGKSRADIVKEIGRAGQEISTSMGEFGREPMQNIGQVLQIATNPSRLFASKDTGIYERATKQAIEKPVHKVLETVSIPGKYIRKAHEEMGLPLVGLWAGLATDLVMFGVIGKGTKALKRRAIELSKRIEEGKISNNEIIEEIKEIDPDLSAKYEEQIKYIKEQGPEWVEGDTSLETFERSLKEVPSAKEIRGYKRRVSEEGEIEGIRSEVGSDNLQYAKETRAEASIREAQEKAQVEIARLNSENAELQDKARALAERAAEISPDDPRQNLIINELEGIRDNIQSNVERSEQIRTTQQEAIAHTSDVFYEMALDEGIDMHIRDNPDLSQRAMVDKIRKELDSVYEGVPEPERPYVDQTDIENMIMSVAVKEGIDLPYLDKLVDKWNKREQIERPEQLGESPIPPEQYRIIVKNSAQELKYIPKMEEASAQLADITPDVGKMTFESFQQNLATYDSIKTHAAETGVDHVSLMRQMGLTNDQIKVLDKAHADLMKKIDKPYNEVISENGEDASQATFKDMPDGRTSFGGNGNVLDNLVTALDNMQALVIPYEKGTYVPPRRSLVAGIVDGSPVKLKAPHKIKDIGSRFWSPHHEFRKVFEAQSNPSIDYNVGQMSYLENVREAMKWARDIKKVVGDEKKALDAYLEPVQKANAKVKDRIDGLASELRATNKQLRQLREDSPLAEKFQDRITKIKDKITKLNDESVERLETAIAEMPDDLMSKPGIKTALHLGDQLPERIPVTAQEQAIVDNARQYFIDMRMDRLKTGMRVRGTDYVPHVIRDVMDFMDNSMLLDAVTKGSKRKFLLDIQRQQNADFITYPDMYTILESYIPIAERTLAFAPIHRKFASIRSELPSKLRSYWDEWEDINFNRKPASGLEKAVNGIVNYEYFRILPFALGVAVKHLTKISGVFSQHAWARDIAPAHLMLAKTITKGIAKKAGIKNKAAELRLYRSFVRVSEMMRAIDEMPVNHKTVMDTIKGVASTMLTAIEAYDNGINVFAGIMHGARKGMTPVQTIRAIHESILDVNFRGGLDQPAWLRKQGTGTLLRVPAMFQMTPLKAFEYKKALIEYTFKNERDAFGTHYGVKLTKMLMFIGLAEMMARANDTSLLEVFMHLPFVHGTFRGQEEAPYVEMHSPETSTSPVFQLIADAGAFGDARTDAAKWVKEEIGPGVFVSLTNQVTDWPQFRKINRTLIEQKYNPNYYDSWLKDWAGFRKFGYGPKKKSKKRTGRSGRKVRSSKR